MALVKCPECGHEVSDEAKVCPNCGYKLKKPKRHPVVYVIAAIAGVVLVVCIGSAIHDLYMANKLSKKSESVQEATSSAAQAFSGPASSSESLSAAAADDENANKIYYGKFGANSHYEFKEGIPSDLPAVKDLSSKVETACYSIGVTDFNNIKFGNYDEQESNGIKSITLSILFSDQYSDDIVADVGYYENVTDEWNVTSVSNFDNGHVYYVAPGTESMVTLYDYSTDTVKQ